MSAITPEELKTAILGKHDSVHAFCKKYKSVIGRSTVYQIVNGKYPGDATKQIARVRDVLEGRLGVTALDKELLKALKIVACAKCKKKGRKSCRKCSQNMMEQVKLLKVVFELVSKGESHVSG